MRTFLLFLPLLGLIISSCTNETADVSSPPSEWVVIGNDLGFRNEFVDMANVVKLADSSLTVFSVAYPDVALEFPVRDSIVIGNKDKHWQMTALGSDSLLLHDTVQNNRYHLLRLKSYVPSENPWEVLTNTRLEAHSFFDERTFTFSGNDTTGTNCYVGHRTRTWGGERRPIRLKDGFWRLDRRFSQPLLLYTYGQGDHYVTLIDSVDAQSGLQGQLIVNSQPNPLLNRRDTLRPIIDTIDMMKLSRDVARLDFTNAKVKPQIDASKEKRWRISWNGAELKKGLSVNDFEVNDLRLFLSEGRFSLTTLGGELASGKFQLHSKYPYLMLDDNCTNELNLPIYYVSPHEIEIVLPIRIRLPNQEIKPSLGGKEQPDRVAYSENEVVFTIPLLPAE